MTIPNGRNPTPTSYLFVLVPGFSMVAFSAAIEPLRAANQRAGRVLYRWQTASTDTNPVAASNGIDLIPDCTIDSAGSCDAVFVCSGTDVYGVDIDQLHEPLQKFAGMNIPIGALCTGAYILAKFGLLHGYRAAINWDSRAGLSEEFPTVVASNELFEIDRDRYTCSGGTSSIELMLQLVARQHGEQLFHDIETQLTQQRVRGCSDCQRMPLQQQLIARHPVLTEATSLMEANIEEPLGLEEIAHYVGVSRRHLERLFQNHLRCVPNRYYMELRLQRARQLILQTGKSLVDIACACGFATAPHFSKCYRDQYGIPPSHERRPSNNLRSTRMHVVRATGT